MVSHNGSERIYTYRGSVHVPFSVDLGTGRNVDFSPIINHPRYNRLDGIGQLSPIPLVAGTAPHKRSEHCLGVFDLAQQVIQRSDLKLDDYDKFLLLGIALLHDIGHGPYSHIYEIVADAYGLPNHKQVGIDVIRNEMRDAITAAAATYFGETVSRHAAHDLAEAMETRSPLSRLITDKDRLDKWDYTLRDAYYCGDGEKGDLEKLIVNLFSDGKRSAIKHPGRQALETFLGALANNNVGIYLRKDVEAVEGQLIRAISYAIDNGFDPSGKNGFDPREGYRFVDSQLDRALSDHKVASRFLDSVHSREKRSQLLSAASIRYKDCGWLVRADHKDVIVVEATDEQISELNKVITLKKLIALEKRLCSELDLAPEELVITSSPQTDRLVLQNPQIVIANGGEPEFKGVFDADVSPELKARLDRKLRQQFSFEFITTEEKAREVRRYIEKVGPVELLQSAA